MNGDGPYDYPSHSTVQNFILRNGLYLLQRDTLLRHDWIWIIDHSYSVGTTKVFLVLGIRLTDFQQLRRPLQHHDLEVLMLLPVEQLNGDIVHLTSRKIEKVLNNDPQWAEFRKACCECANAVRHYPLAHLKPPRPKTKACYTTRGRK